MRIEIDLPPSGALINKQVADLSFFNSATPRGQHDAKKAPKCVDEGDRQDVFAWMMQHVQSTRSSSRIASLSVD